MSDDNVSKQSDEIEALASIYGNAVVVRINDGQRCCDVAIDADVTLTVTMPPSYPNESPPVFEISAPYLNRRDKQVLHQKLEEIYADNFIGEPGVVYAWTECIREFLEERQSVTKSATTDADESASLDDVSDEFSNSLRIKSSAPGNTVKCPEILTGGCIEDRKSVFQPHYAKVTCLEEVQLVSISFLLHVKQRFLERITSIWRCLCVLGRGMKRKRTCDSIRGHLRSVS